MNRLPTLLLLLMISTPATAQVIYTDWLWHEWEVTPFGGASFLGHSRNFVTPTIGVPGGIRTVGMRYGSGYMVGVNCRQNLGDYWAADLQYTFANQPLEFTNISPDLPTLGLSHTISNFSYNGTYHFQSYSHRFLPYVRAGGGASLFFLEGGSERRAEAALGVRLRDSWTPTFSYGGGFQYLFDDLVGVTFDARDTISSVPSYGLPKSAAVVNGVFFPGIARDGVLHNFQVNFGLTIRWDDWVR